MFGYGKAVLLGLVFVVPAQQVATPHPEPKRPSQSVSGPHTAPVAPLKYTPNPLCNTKPEECYVPLDNWLKQKGSPLSGRDFYEVGRAYHIDPDVLVAITSAETNLGRVVQRGVPGNVGSVGSYDSTNTTLRASSYREGITQIAQTLNNEYLGSKVTVAQLSRKSEPYGHVYAESRYNWEVNVVNTLSELKGRSITNQWQFRG